MCKIKVGNREMGPALGGPRDSQIIWGESLLGPGTQKLYHICPEPKPTFTHSAISSLFILPCSLPPSFIPPPIHLHSSPRFFDPCILSLSLPLSNHHSLYLSIHNISFHSTFFLSFHPPSLTISIVPLSSFSASFLSLLVPLFSHSCSL